MTNTATPTDLTNDLLARAQVLLNTWRALLPVTAYDSDERWYVYEDIDEMVAELLDAGDNPDVLSIDFALRATASELLFAAIS